MKEAIFQRFPTIGGIFNSRIFKIAFSAWAVLGTYDLMISQIIPEKFSDRFPRLRDAVEASSGIFPIWIWVLFLAIIVMLGGVEYAHRANKRYGRPHDSGAYGPVPDDLSKESGNSLKIFVRQFGDRLRAFDAGYRNSLAKELVRKYNKSVEETQPVFKITQSEIILKHSAAIGEYRTNLHPIAMRLRAEIMKRRGIFPPYPHDVRAIALEHGTLAGPSPLADLADYLEENVAFLPD